MIKNARLLTSATSYKKLPALNQIEIAVIGRSNSGKSTFINRVTGRKNLARTSSTPGHTKTINLFEVTLRDNLYGINALCMADLPGFGYAKASKKIRDSLWQMATEYLAYREPLSLLILTNDIRRDPEQEELFLRDLCFERGVSVIVSATKSDKLNRQQRTKRLAAIASIYSLEEGDIYLTGRDSEGDNFWDMVLPIVC
ncbi:MAG: ribosome biogenesis GTP-binding protein YsxC [Candidatus Dadabacteria bacterium]|nr:MAG: ribosome biogenesis GTP-binding protein YsxC [Candidatus Dadabacteria bacterium]